MHDRVLPVLIFASLTLADPLASQATVSPADRVTLEGSSSTSYPLGRASMRLQQLLADLPTRVMTLQGHAYRRDAATVRGTVAAFRAQVSVLASVSPRTPDTASSTFATNHGAQIHTALAPTWISFPQTDRPPVDPAASFELRIPWTAPMPWSGNGVLCLETVVHGNDVGGQQNRNFTSYQDAHELATTSSRQPGFRFGDGCAFPATTAKAYASFDLVRTTTGIDLEAAIRNGAPTDANGPSLNVLMLGLAASPWAWPLRTECTVYVPPLASDLLGQSDVRGQLDVVRRNFGDLPPGRVVFAQVLSLQPSTALGALTDASRLTSPGVVPATIAHARIAHADDALALTGTVSLAVPVTELF